MQLRVTAPMSGILLCLHGCTSEPTVMLERAGAGGTVYGSAGRGGAAAAGSGGSGPTLGPSYEGGEYHLGPVDWEETVWHNACAPSTKYAPAVRAAEGQLLAGLWQGIEQVAQYCDACIEVTTARGKSAVLRVVTYGDTTPNSIDVSPEAYSLLDSGEYPRSMQWQVTKCADTGPMLFEFQTGSNPWWTSLWIRNARLPNTRAEVKSQNHAEYAPLQRGSDGTLTDTQGFGEGNFQLRLTALDGQTHEESFTWPTSGIAGQLLTGQGNFR